MLFLLMSSSSCFWKVGSFWSVLFLCFVCQIVRSLTSRRSQPPLALAVPLSRFTSRVGGGSAFYVRLLKRMAITPFPKKIRVMGQRVAFPPICPHCLQPATDTIEISSRGTVVGYCDAYSSRVYHTIRVPFCDRFIRKHRWIPFWTWRAERYVQLLPTTGESIEIGAINEQYAKELASINGTTIIGWFD
jgi:hypothetical protein